MNNFFRFLFLFIISGNVFSNIIPKLVMNDKSKGNILVFLSKDCPCSKANLPYLKKIAEEFPDFTMTAIHSKKNSSENEIVNFFSSNGSELNIVNDSNLNIADQYGALKTPHVFIIKNNEVIYNGGITNSTHPQFAKKMYLKDALISIREKGVPNIAITKTMGCFISR